MEHNKIIITENDIYRMISESVNGILEKKSKPNLSYEALTGQKLIKPGQQDPAGQQNGQAGPKNTQQGQNGIGGVGGLLNGVRNFVRKTYNTTMGNYNSQFTNPKYMNNRNGMVQADSNGQSQMSYKEANKWLEKSGMKATDVIKALNNPGGNSAFDILQTQDPILAQKVIALCKMLTK